MKAFRWALVCMLLFERAAFADAYKDFNSGIAEAQRAESAEAIRYLSLALTEPGLPEHLRPVAFLARGRQYSNLEKYDSAIADFTSAIQLRSNYIEAYISRCAAYADQSEMAKALEDCKYAAQSEPDNWRFRENILRLHVEQKQFDDAIADYSNFMLLRPNDAGLLLGRASIYRSAGIYDKALQDAKAANSLFPAWSEPYAVLGLIYFSQGKLEEARQSFASEADYARKDPIAYLQKGQVEWAMGRYADASDSFRDALKRKDNEPYIFMWLAIAEARAGKQIPKDIVDRFSSVTLSKWPGLLLAPYLGRSEPPDVQRFKGSDPDGDDDKQCAASFFVGEWYLTNNNPGEAKRLLQNAVSHCSATSMSRTYAAIDLGRLP